MPLLQIWGELVLVDIDKAAIEKREIVAIRFNDYLDAGYKVSSTTDRLDALPGADLVTVSIAANLMKMSD